MATQYDPSIIQTFADRLYAQADRIAFVYGALGFLIGAAGAGALGSTASDGGLASVLIAGTAGGALLGMLFAMAGYSRAFTLRLQAQTALCQAQIEANSRRQ